MNDKVGILRERDAHIANLESEINEILSKLNLLQNEKGKLMDNEAVSMSQSQLIQKSCKYNTYSTLYWSLGLQVRYCWFEERVGPQQKELWQGENEECRSGDPIDNSGPGHEVQNTVAGDWTSRGEK